MKKKVVTLAELKGEKVRLRNELEKDDYGMEALSKYLNVSRKVKELESFLLWTILTLIIFISGCYSIHGIGKDLSTWSRPYIENADR